MKTPAWQLLVEAGQATSRHNAEALILAGKVRLGSERVNKAGHTYPAQSILTVTSSRYVGRGGDKLESALTALAINPAGRTCLDAGACTGGFTHCLRLHGASRVYAVEAGTGQLAGILRNDQGVVNLEGTNLGEVDPALLVPPPDLAVADLSYLSLRQAVPLLLPLLVPPRELCLLVKPLFEVQDSALRRSGKIEDPAVYRQVLLTLVEHLVSMGLTVHGVVASGLKGSGGTSEFFIHLQGPDILPQTGSSRLPPPSNKPSGATAGVVTIPPDLALLVERAVSETP